MRKRKVGRKFGRKAGSRRALVAGLAEALFRHGRIRTTEARAQEAQRFAERTITIGREGTLAARRRLEQSFSSDVAGAIMREIAPRFLERSGGYTRIVKLPFRGGDRAPMAYLELLETNQRK